MTSEAELLKMFNANVEAPKPQPASDPWSRYYILFLIVALIVLGAMFYYACRPENAMVEKQQTILQNQEEILRRLRHLTPLTQ